MNRPIQAVRSCNRISPIVDVHRNFARRWNSRVKQLQQAGAADLPPSLERPWLEKIGASALLANAQPLKQGSAQVQIVRSVSSDHLSQEGVNPTDLQLYPDARERKVWADCLPAWMTQHQGNILTAMVNCIRSADNYIYIETQFFISQFGVMGTVDSRKIGNEDDGIKNTIVDELAKRICQHINAGSPFHVYLVIPVHPEGSISDGSVWKQQWMALTSIKHGSDSLINRIKRKLVDKKRDPEEWVQYLTVLNMRNYGATVQYARHPETFNEEFDREIGRFVVTEQIYIHSKLLIVDDAVAIIGSANTNDRSLTGNGDTEIAAVVVDTEGVELRDLGSPGFKVQTRKFARELRQQLWAKHFGFLVESTDKDHSDYFWSPARAGRNKASVQAVEAFPYPPRLKMTQAVFCDRLSGNLGIKREWRDIVDKPCHPDTVRTIQAISKHNASVYEEVFSHTPRDSMKTFDVVDSFFVLPYPPAFDRLGTPALDTLHPKSQVPVVPLPPAERARAEQAAQRVFDGELKAGGKDIHFAGVQPPALNPNYMTTRLLPHQQTAMRDPRFYRRHQVYEGGTVHDVQKAIQHLSKNVIGFFVATPLDWGMGTAINGDPSKHQTVDISQAEPPGNNVDENRA